MTTGDFDTMLKDTYGIAKRTVQYWRTVKKIPYGMKVGRKRIYSDKQVKHITSKLRSKWVL